MRIAVISDVHGNLPALEAVLADIEREEFDLVVSCGDVVAGPMPAAVLDRLVALGERIRWVRGNADREVVEAFARRGSSCAPHTGTSRPSTAAERSAAFAAAALSRPQRDLLAAFEPVVRAGDALFCHGTPASDTAIVTPATPAERLEWAVAGVAEPIVVGGHVHFQFVQRASAVQWINAGSVGMPYEGAPGAYWLALGPEGPDHRRSDYDVEAAIAVIAATGYPDPQDVAQSVRGQITREEVIAVFDPAQ